MEITDQDSVNTLIAEDRAVRKEENTLKTRILNMVDPTRRMEEWKKHFGVKEEHSDEWMLTAKIF